MISEKWKDKQNSFLNYLEDMHVEIGDLMTTMNNQYVRDIDSSIIDIQKQLTTSYNCIAELLVKRQKGIL